MVKLGIWHPIGKPGGHCPNRRGGDAAVYSLLRPGVIHHTCATGRKQAHGGHRDAVAAAQSGGCRDQIDAQMRHGSSPSRRSPCCLDSTLAEARARPSSGISTCTSRRRILRRRAAPRCSPRRSRRRPTANSRSDCISPARCRSTPSNITQAVGENVVQIGDDLFNSGNIPGRRHPAPADAGPVLRGFRQGRRGAQALYREGVRAEGLDGARLLHLSAAVRVGPQEARSRSTTSRA